MTWEEIARLLLAGGGGAVLAKAAEWFFSRGDKRHDYEQAISDANDALSKELREELRRDREAYRERLRGAEDRISELVGQVQQLSRTNDSLRAENLLLQKQAGQDTYRLNKQSEIIADQALKISTMQNDLAMAKDRIDVLEAALRQSNIDVPAARKPGTGPLGQAATP